MCNDFDLAAFEQDLRETLERGHEAFVGQYAHELEELLGLSREEIDRITPDITDLESYDQLVSLVKEASRVNLSQAQLRLQITQLGSVAVDIAKRVPSLARILEV